MSSDAEKNLPVCFETLADLCLKYRCFQSPSLFHGVLTGQLCGQDKLPREQWLLLFTQLLGEQVNLPEQDRKLALELLDQTLEQLGSGQMDFEPLLPDELYEVEERFAALIKWLQGFLKSLKAAQIDQEKLSQEAKEGLSDLEKIVEAGDLTPAANEENEKDLHELSEFVRLVAMMLYLELHPGRPQVEKPQSGSSLH
ncbi:hypothetical protein SAMN05660443_2260 [Marinospirillum celere]|uniref:YecA family protein n=1 Tax=Marinospirillum celere TaxID=1122252 RepID=A0A1I1I8F3_9GAMM|nr:YecA family protein [Marinospirillum celere]SFC32331.1 hypothetical protein SAMN05660443_2260 [Marinospirillum celere]